MDPASWRRISNRFAEAIELANGDARAAYLARLKHDGELNAAELEELGSLIRAHEQAPTQGIDLESPPRQAAVWAALPIPPWERLAPGEMIGDFSILRRLGGGTAACVYVARETALDRVIALKVSADLGLEGRTLAKLEHPGIVRVFSESRWPERDLRAVAMQYVPGTSLQSVLQAGRELTGRHLLEIVDTELRDAGETTVLDPTALAHRERFARLDPTEAALAIGAQIARALEFAHRMGVLHLDVKPANILLDAYGRAYLVDFNVSASKAQLAHSRPERLGGTPEYMSPAQAEALRAPTPANLARLDAEADFFALGRVLERFGLPPARWTAAKLEGALELRAIEREQPGLERGRQFERRHPWLAFGLVALTPQLLGSTFNILYNLWRIVARLTPAQQAAFNGPLLLGYNLVFYPIGLWVLLRHAGPLLRQRRSGAHRPSREMRARALGLPRALLLATSVGWLPCAAVFPGLLAAFWGPLAPGVALHFVTSFLVSWLIAFAYSALFAQTLALRVYYPTLWSGETDIRQQAARELASVPQQARAYQLLCGLIPLSAAALVTFNMIGDPGGNAVSANAGADASARWLLMALIALGMAGFTWSLWLGAQITRVLRAFA